MRASTKRDAQGRVRPVGLIICPRRFPRFSINTQNSALPIHKIIRCAQDSCVYIPLFVCCYTIKQSECVGALVKNRLIA